MSFKIVAVLVISICLSVNSEFPDDPKPCKYEDAECIKETINFLFKNKLKGDDSINLTQLYPVKYDKVRIQQGEENPVSLDLLLKNNQLYGLEKAKALKVKGFGKDLTKKHSLVLHTDYLSVIGDYEINGKVLILPITGSGKSNITMVDVDLMLNFVGTPLVKDGATYMNVKEIKVQVVPKRMIYTIKNLFNGDKVLGDNMNLFLNENWQEIFNEVRDSLDKAFAEVFQKIISSVFSKYPYEKYFTE